MAPHHLFLSYHRSDREPVDHLRRQLERRGVETFMDRDLELGLSWPERLENALRNTRAVAVVFGPAGLGRWQKREMYVALDRQVVEEKAGRRFPVIPVLLPAAREDDLGGSFLRLNTWVDLRRGVDDREAVDALARMCLGRGELGAGRPLGELLNVCPYRGLRSFRVEDHGFFFGRERDVGELLDRVESKRKGGSIVVLGPSGAGKSSLVQAGLIPRLYALRPPATTWDVIALRPGEEPFRSLARELVPILEPELGKIDRMEKIEPLAAILRTNPQEPILQILKDSRATERILLVVDPFEEIVAAPTPRQLGRDFARSLVAMQERSPVTLLLTLRDSFYGDVVQLDEGLTRLIERQGVFHLRAPDRDDLESVVRGPAQKLGVGFERGLVERILDDVGTEPGRLPLLEFALERLWYRDKDSRILTLDGYQSVGKVERAITRKADAVYDGLDEEQRAALRRVMLRLVHLGEPEAGSLDTRQRIALASLGEAEQDPVRELIEARLLLTHGEPEEPVLEVAHEALIRHWQTLRRWLDEKRSFLLWRQRLRESVRQWLGHARDASYLYTGRRLEQAEEEMRSQPDLLDDVDVEFIRASIDDRDRKIEERQRQLRKIRIGIRAAVLLAGLVIAAVVVTWIQYRTNLRYRFAGEARHLAQASLAGVRDEPQPAAILAAEALRASQRARPFRDGDAETALREALNRLGGTPLPLPLEDRVLAAVALDDGDARVASTAGDDYLRLTRWEWPEPATRERTRGPERVGEHLLPVVPRDPCDDFPPPLRVRLSRDGRRIWVEDRDGSQRALELVAGEDGTSLQRVEPPQDTAQSVADPPVRDGGKRSSPTGRWGVNVFNDRFELVGERTLKLVGHELNRNEESQGIAFSPNEEWAVTWSGREARLWDLSAPRPGAGREPQILSEDRLPDIGFQPAERWQVRAGDGRRPEVGRSEDELRECDANGPVHEGDVKVAVLSPDGGFLFTAGTKDSGRLWSLDAGGSCSFRSFGFVDPAAAAAFGAGERWLVIGSSEGRVFLSDPRVRELRASARRLHPAAGRATVRVLALSDDARWLFAATDPGEARLWELEDGRSLYSVTFPELEPIRAATFPPDGRHLATEHDNGVVRRWRLLRDEASREELIDLACRAAGRNLTCEEWRDAFGTGEPYRRTCPDLYGPARPCDARREEPACGAVSMP